MTTVVITTFNSASVLEACLANVLIHTPSPLQILIVDNGSSDDTVWQARRLSVRDSRIRILEGKSNQGYAKASNLGAKEANGDFLVFLNPDTEVHHDWLPPLLSALEDDRTGAVGPMSDVVAGDQWIGHRAPVQATLEEAVGALRRTAKGQTTETKLLVGFCLAMKREVFEKVGGMDENLFLGADDLELSWRLRTKGYRLQVCLDSFVKHVGGASFAQLGPSLKDQYVRLSDAALKRKLEAHYGDLSGITSDDLWGCDIFEGALRDGTL